MEVLIWGSEGNTFAWKGTLEEKGLIIYGYIGRFDMTKEEIEKADKDTQIYKEGPWIC